VPPFQDQAGVEVILRCDKAIPKLEAYHMPSRKEVEEQLFDQQVTAFARRYMRDLRRQADVELR
jgi:peptidyl-prolyl cis-trans isomerase SurA